VVVNPISVRTSFRSHALIDEEAELPALVQFYPFGSDIRTAVLEDDGFELIERLCEAGPSTLEEIGDLMLFKVSREELIDLIHDLLEMGLVALV
jgi:hypothetical protein